MIKLPFKFDPKHESVIATSCEPAPRKGTVDLITVVVMNGLGQLRMEYMDPYMAEKFYSMFPIASLTDRKLRECIVDMAKREQWKKEEEAADVQ